MRAAVIEELGGRPVVRDVPDPSPGEGDDVVSISTAALNPADLVYAAGIRLKPTLPYVPMAPPPYGTFAERSVARAGSALPVPDDVTDAQALGVGVAGITGYLALAWKGRLVAGESVLVTGATGAVGQVVVQAAAALGASRVVAAGRNRAVLERLLELGADGVVVLEGDYAGGLERASGDGFDLVVDALFGEPMMAAIRATRMGGRVVNLGMRAGRSMTLDGVALKGKDLLSCNIGDAPAAELAASFDALLGLVAAGRIHTASETVPLEDVASIWDRQESSPHGKLLVDVSG